MEWWDVWGPLITVVACIVIIIWAGAEGVFTEEDEDENSYCHDCPSCGNHHRREDEDIF